MSEQKTQPHQITERIVNRFADEALGLPVTLALTRLSLIIIEELESRNHLLVAAQAVLRIVQDGEYGPLAMDLALEKLEEAVDWWTGYQVVPPDFEEDAKINLRGDNLDEFGEDDNFEDTTPDEVAEAPSIDLGLCCACLTNPAVGVALLPFRAPVPGTGWGCFACGLPSDGAIAVLCEACGESGAEVQEVCWGMPAEGKRMSFEGLPQEPFEHDLSKHPEYEYDGEGLVTSRFDDTPTVPPPDDAEALRLMTTAFDGAPTVKIEIGAFEAFNLVGLIQLCLRHPELPGNVRKIAKQLALDVERTVGETVPAVAPLLKYGRDPHYDRDKDGNPLHP